MKKADKNKIWPAASQSSLLKWPNLKHILTRPPNISAAACNHHRIQTVEDQEQVLVQYYPPPTTPHHHYMIISRSSSSMGDSDSHDHQQQMSSREYWDARRVFLSSYSFTAKKADGGPMIMAMAAVRDMDWLKCKGKLWVKEVKEAAVGFGRYVVREVKRRKVVWKGYRLTFALPSFVVIRVRCFTPWITSKTSELSLRL